jgi:hypothetical protein
MFSTESLKSSSSQALGFLGSGKGHQEVEVDLRVCENILGYRESEKGGDKI